MTEAEAKAKRTCYTCYHLASTLSWLVCGNRDSPKYNHMIDAHSDWCEQHPNRKEQADEKANQD